MLANEDDAELAASISLTVLKISASGAGAGAGKADPDRCRLEVKVELYVGNGPVCNMLEKSLVAAHPCANFPLKCVLTEHGATRPAHHSIPALLPPNPQPLTPPPPLLSRRRRRCPATPFGLAGGAGSWRPAGRASRGRGPGESRVSS